MARRHSLANVRATEVLRRFSLGKQGPAEEELNALLTLSSLSEPSVPTCTVSENASKPAASAGSESRQPSRPWVRSVGMLIVALQVLWAMIVPIKNVVMIGKPQFRIDTVVTEKRPYSFEPQESPTVEFKGSDVLPLLRGVLDVVLGNVDVRDNLEAGGGFDIDVIYQVLSPAEYHIISQYYALLFQSSELPGGVLTPVGSGENLSIWIRNSSSGEVNQEWELKLACAASDQRLHGMKCAEESGICNGFAAANTPRTHSPVDLAQSYKDSGLSNNIGLLFVVESFHSVLMTLFNTKSWKKTLEALMVLSDSHQALMNGFSSVYKDNKPLLLDTAAGAYGIRLENINTTTARLDSCFITEIIVANFYTRAFVMELIQDALLQRKLYEPLEFHFQGPNDTATRLRSVFDFNLVLTTGARPSPIMKKSTRLFDGGELASVANVTMRLKQDRKHNGETVYGSSVRMLQYMTYYPGLYSHLNASSQLLLDSVTQELQQYDVHTFRIIGSGTSGLNTFKDDWWASTMQTYRLAEIPNNSTTPVFDAWWDEEARVAAWFGGVERSPSAPFFMLDRYFRIKSTGIVLDDDPTTRCHRALFKTLGKLLFMGVTSQVSTIGYTVFMSDADGHIRAWAQNVARKFELHGETLVGKKYAFSYSPSAVVRKDDGSAWVMVPLVEAMVRELQFETMLNLVLGGYNESFTTLVSAEAGKVHFSDSYHCIVDLVDTVVDTSDSTAQIRNKLYPGVVRFFTDLMVGIHDMYANLSADLLQKEGIQMVKIPKELLANNSVDDGSGGSPLQWQPTALTAGILKFFPGMTPPVNVIWEYRNATRCYRSLELRYLNESVRCWVEENSNEKGRVEYKSEAFRLIMFSNWSISLVLNCIAIAIALEF